MSNFEQSIQPEQLDPHAAGESFDKLNSLTQQETAEEQEDREAWEAEFLEGGPPNPDHPHIINEHLGKLTE